MKHEAMTAESFGTGRISSIIIRLTPPVMIAQFIQAMYNTVDSFFVGRFSEDGLTALSVIYPLQLLITALAVGTGSGVNTLMARLFAQHEEDKANHTGGMGIVLALMMWFVLSILSVFFIRPFVKISTNSPQAVEYAMQYGRIVIIGSLGIFLESIFTKIHQATGNMVLPTIAQVSGAVTNIILDPILIFGLGPFPSLGISGAAIATVIGQFVAAIITGATGFRKPPVLHGSKWYVKGIYHYGFPSILLQFLWVVYITALNMILAGFTDAAITVLGLYYKLQSFFFIPMFALQTSIVPVLSYNYTQQSYSRCREIMKFSAIVSASLMTVGVFCFEAIPGTLIGLFSRSDEVLYVGVPAFRLIGLSFYPAVLSMLSPTFFQAIGASRQSSILAITRQVFCLIPIFWLLSKIGLAYTWLAFPASEIITGAIGSAMYMKEIKSWSK